jgi:alcohol dehydrogenase (cytochrome c)
MMIRRILSIVALALTLGVPALAGQQQTAPDQITGQDLLEGLKNPSRWLTFSGDYTGQRHSPLKQLTPENVAGLVPQWIFQTDMPGLPGRGIENTPIVVDGILYVTGNNNEAWAIDGRTGRPIWSYRRRLPANFSASVCCGPVNRGFGILGDRLYMGTLDAHLLALDRKTGSVIWDVAAGDLKKANAITAAPLIIKNKVIIGVSGGDFSSRGYIDAYDAQSGERVWHFNTIPLPGEPGSESWPSIEVAERGGGGAWVTGSYDPTLNLVYYGTGNPNPDYYGDDREGQSLYLLTRGARRRYRQVAVVFPIHAARRARLGLGARSGAGRPDDRRPESKSDHGRQPKRFFLYARPRIRKTAGRQAVHRRLKLGQGDRCGRPADRS